MKLNRRRFLAAAALGVGAWRCAANPKRRFPIGICDWSIGKTSDSEALEIASRIGLDGVQVSLGTLANDMRLRRREAQEEYQEASSKWGVRPLSLAIGELNNIPYKSDPRTIPWVRDGIDVCRAMECRVLLLAFFHKNDLRDDPAGVAETIRRLKDVAPKAEQAGVILGLETWLSAEDHMRIIDGVGSPAVKVYYDVANSTERGYDIEREIRWLGRQDQICEFHMKENGALLGHGKIDFKKVRRAIDAIDYSGPIQIEGANPPGKDRIESAAANLKFLRSLFGDKAETPG